MSRDFSRQYPLMHPFTTSMRKHIGLFMVSCSHAITVVSNEVVQGTTLVYNLAKPEQYIDEAHDHDNVYADRAHEHTPAPVCMHEQCMYWEGTKHLVTTFFPGSGHQ